jgi:hypothetical protein
MEPHVRFSALPWFSSIILLKLKYLRVISLLACIESVEAFAAVTAVFLDVMRCRRPHNLPNYTSFHHDADDTRFLQDTPHHLLTIGTPALSLQAHS